MHYLVSVDHNSMPVPVKDFKNCCISNAVDESDDDVLRNSRFG